ncbi:hypothetical protein [Pseudomonas gingeri]|uniref:Uncharacterized protein n=1 Tax=Pseudomonas gingeri TaxID=117681 RepID=A0A7Y7YIC9_9PSED|nr:hypothetical protein [Pseudomonas gingeri]NWA04502.1 hypothetical protein [Pseudomonas gingeri]NWA17311.1 hypothetical protein [Pseudomonas gingeri]NWA56333.1 hypothetical protein [Pseudomonas gingeri]NWA98105.1 hypothetical protein [Pseudomonas gingeri]NWB02527.1 hypothetical protein [Pseudomonas gingeri]
MRPAACLILFLYLLTPAHGARPPEIVMDTRNCQTGSGLQDDPASS